MSVPELLIVILDIAKELVGAEGASLLLVDEETDDLIFNIVQGGRGEIKGDRLPKGMGIAGYVAQTGESLIVNDAQNDPRFFKEIDNKYNFYTKNIIAVPMKVMNRLVGVLEAINSIDRENFDDWDLKLLNYLAELAAIAISNRKLYYELNRRIEELTVLYDLSQSISSSNMDENMYHTIITSVTKSLGAEKGSIILYDEEKGSLVLKSSVGLPDSVLTESEIDMHRSISGIVYKNGDPLIVTDITKEISFPFIDNSRNYRTRSFISVPIRYKNNIIGVINLADKKNQQPFDAFDLRVLSTIGNQIADIHENILFQKRLIEQKRLENEIDIAAEIQSKILPKIPSSFKGHTFAAFTKPAKEIGGDFYDFFIFDENKYAVTVADVSGKGIPAAIFMGMARNIIRAESRVNSLPGKILQNSNRYIYQDSEQGMFITVVYLMIDSHNNIITFSCAGHNDQILFRKNGEIFHLKAVGKPLGIDPDSTFEEKVISFAEGDLLLLFTDGLLETLGHIDIEKGEEKLIEIVKSCHIGDASHIVSTIQSHVENEHIDDPLVDDITLFAIKF
ncbi:MAG: SpoIIE family protein phosphatase [Spirochaetes bacterium]|nr:SpoIIE family protein phosphatase [Spirochaetota bacterium]